MVTVFPAPSTESVSIYLSPFQYHSHIRMTVSRVGVRTIVTIVTIVTRLKDAGRVVRIAGIIRGRTARAAERDNIARVGQAPADQPPPLADL